ncbi:toll/interleukin-1 receptor domain-containing protein [Stieleria varia]|uniref:TIR domain-containing protein n=1 Tax=Stieleria varia TaxID=2528005 RepID=A0A5C6B8X2_9BACT|nr:hypothetical protein Pla52n_10010 [Stieleria varia]
MTFRVFLSYKSQDSNLARHVASWLRHNQIECWFAEDQIPLEGQEDFKAIVDQIAKGITQATHVLVFSSDLYVQADWCQIEFQLLRACDLLSSKSAAEIRLAPRDAAHLAQDSLERMWNHPQIGDVPRMNSRSDRILDLQKLERFLRVDCGWPLPETMQRLVTEPDLESVPVHLPFLGLSIRLPGWKARDIGIRHLGEDFEFSQSFVRDVNGIVDLEIRANRFPRNSSPFDNDGTSDDLDLRRDAYAMAKYFQSQLPANQLRHVTILGIHLVFIGSRSHFAISFAAARSGGPLVAYRKYVLVLWDEQTSFHYELVFTFCVHGPPERLRSLEPMLESIIQSFRYSESAMQTFRMVNQDFVREPPLDPSRFQHPISNTSGSVLSRFESPSGFFEPLPPATDSRNFLQRLANMPEQTDVAFSELGGWHRFSKYIRNPQVKP